MPFWVIAGKSPARITPAAKRNTYSVATFSLFVPRVEALRTSTLGYYTNKSCYSVRVAISRRALLHSRNSELLQIKNK